MTDWHHTRIHKGGFDAVEEHHPDQQHDQHEAAAVQQPARADRAGAQEGVAEGLDDGGHRVGLDDHW